MARKAFCATLLVVFTAGGLFPFASAAEKPTISLLVHPGENIITDSLSQVTLYIEDDLLQRLKQYGYNVQRISYAQDFVPEPKHFLLSVVVVQYTPQVHLSKTLMVRYELTGLNNKVLFSERRSETTKRHWTRLVTTLNDRMLNDIDEKIRKALSSE